MRFEGEEVKAVALGIGWVAVVTRLNFLRIFTEGGLQEDRDDTSRRKHAKQEAIVGPAIDKGVAHKAVGLKPAMLVPKEVPKEVPKIKKKNPVLQNAIGAIDGTHIPVVVRKGKQAHYRCRKGFTSQNMMAACSFDHQFLFVCTGWEGSTADMRVLRWCCESGGFTVPEGKFYLVDSRYANTDRFLAPYRGERYHLSQFDVTARAHRHRGPRDLYNHRHAQLRNVVEKTFGILNRHFKVLRQATPYPYKVQCRNAVACCVIHNFIKMHQGNDLYFNSALEPVSLHEQVEDPIPLVGLDDARQGDTLCTMITKQLWSNR